MARVGGAQFLSNAMKTPPEPSGRSQQPHVRRQKVGIASLMSSAAPGLKSSLNLRCKADVTGCAGSSKIFDGRRCISAQQLDGPLEPVRPAMCNHKNAKPIGSLLMNNWGEITDFARHVGSQLASGCRLGTKVSVVARPVSPLPHSMFPPEKIKSAWRLASSVRAVGYTGRYQSRARARLLACPGRAREWCAAPSAGCW